MLKAKLTQPGFLLCWDSPSRVYIWVAVPIIIFTKVISTLSVKNQSKVVVITDYLPCRKALQGSQIGGAQLTTAKSRQAIFQ